MNIINSTALRNNLFSALNEVNLDKDYLLISKRGKIKNAIVNIDFLEELLAQTNNGYLASIKKARKEYKNKQIYSHEQVFS